jgi:single-strand DNA-binding protein
MSVNVQILVGRIGQDAELKHLANGTGVVNFSVATSKRLKDDKEETQWHRCTLYGKLADAISQYLKKGTQVYLEGETRHRKYTTKAGVEAYVTEVIVEKMELLGGKPKAAQEMKPEDDTYSGPSGDIPF